MPTRIAFDFYGDVQLERTIDRTIDRAEDASPAWEAIANSLVRAERRQFATEGGYASGGRAPLSPAYAAWKARHYPGKPILERTGRLKASLTERPLGVEVIRPHSAILGSHVPYGLHHQRGGGRPPPRRPVELPESIRREWVKIVQRWIVTGKV